MMHEIVFLVEESQDGGYSSRAMGFAIFTQADSLEELRVNIRDAVTCHFEEHEKPKIIRLHIVKQEILAA